MPLVGLGAISTALKKGKIVLLSQQTAAVLGDFEPELKNDNVFLFSIDDLGAQIDENMKSRLSSAEEARTIENNIEEFSFGKKTKNCSNNTTIEKQE